MATADQIARWTQAGPGVWQNQPIGATPANAGVLDSFAKTVLPTATNAASAGAVGGPQAALITGGLGLIGGILERNKAEELAEQDYQRQLEFLPMEQGLRGMLSPIQSQAHIPAQLAQQALAMQLTRPSDFMARPY